MDAESVQRIVVTELGFTRVTMKKQTTPAMKPINSAGNGFTKPDAGVMATSPATQPEMPPSTLGLPAVNHSARSQPSVAAAAPKCVATKALVASAEAASALPALNPNQPTHSRQAPMKLMTRLCGFMGSTWIALTLAHIQRADQRRNAGRDVHDRAAGEIEARNFAAGEGVQEAALAPHHVRHREVDDQHPQDREQQHGAVFHALGERAGDQRGGDDREHELVDHEGLLRDGGGVVGIGERCLRC